MSDSQTSSASEGTSLADRVRSLRLPDRPTSPPGGSSKFAWLMFLVAMAAAGYLGYRAYRAESALAEAPTTPSTEANASANDSPGRSSSGQQFLETGGYLLPLRRVQVSPKVGGQVTKMFYEEGEPVERGKPLAHIDRTKFEFNYREKLATAQMLQAEYQKAKANAVIEEKLRTASLAEGKAAMNLLLNKKNFLVGARTGATQEELSEIEFQIVQAREKVKQLERNLQMNRELSPLDIEQAHKRYQQAQVLADNAKDDLDNTIVLAPSSGTILKKYAEEGNMVRPEAFSNGLSASLYDLADLKKMEVEVDISERDLEFVHPGQLCEIRLEAYPDRTYNGKVSRLMPEADRSKASVAVRVRVEVPDGDTLLRPELRARVRFLNDQ